LVNKAVEAMGDVQFRGKGKGAVVRVFAVRAQAQ